MFEDSRAIDLISSSAMAHQNISNRSVPHKKGGIFLDHETDMVQGQIPLQIKKKDVIALLNKDKAQSKNSRVQPPLQLLYSV